MRKISTRGAEVTYAIAGEEPFVTHGALSAMLGAAGTGQLPQEWRAIYQASREAGTIRYTVLSYDTPIAWTTTLGELFVPKVRYSVTTSQHQGSLYRLLGLYSGRIIRELRDLGAPAEADRPTVSPHSGEGALYSPEYLAMRQAKTPAS